MSSSKNLVKVFGKKSIIYSLTIISIHLPVLLYSQKPERIEITQAAELEGKGKLTILRGEVILKEGAFLYICDSVYYFRRENYIEGFGNIIVKKNDAVICKGDYIKKTGGEGVAYIQNPSCKKDLQENNRNQIHEIYLR